MGLLRYFNRLTIDPPSEKQRLHINYSKWSSRFIYFFQHRLAALRKRKVTIVIEETGRPQEIPPTHLFSL